MKITAIGIRFSDNDFGNSIRPWLRAVVESFIYKGLLDPDESEKIRGWRPDYLTKQYVVDLFYKTIMGFYLMYQCDDHTNVEESKLELTSNYLKNHRVEVFFNEEVHNYIQENDYWDNFEFFYWDKYAGHGVI